MALGRTKLVQAGDMKELSWDNSLAEAAQAHADQCRFRHDCGDCRRDFRFGVGQNLLRDRGQTFLPPDWSFTVNSWFREIENFPSYSVRISTSLS